MSMTLLGCGEPEVSEDSCCKLISRVNLAQGLRNQTVLSCLGLPLALLFPSMTSYKDFLNYSWI